MFFRFPSTLKNYGFDTDVRFLMDLHRSMEIGLVTNLGSLFDVGKHLICKSRREIAPYTLAFWDHFLGIDTKNYNTINEAILNSSSGEILSKPSVNIYSSSSKKLSI